MLISSFALLLVGTVLAPLIAAPDLDVSYISRTPRYDRYFVDYKEGANPSDPYTPYSYLTKEEQDKQRWPKAGEVVTFTAVVKNPGDAPTGDFSYKWYFDGKEVDSGKLPSIKPGEEVSATYKWTWDSEWNDHKIKFVADPDNLIKEDIKTNNSVEDPTNALSFRFHIWKKLYDWFLTDAKKTAPQIASFDDWAQQQIFWMNKMFSEAVYSTSPKGILERVRLDEIVIVPDETPDQDPGATHAPLDIQWDAKRGFMYDEYYPIFQEDLSVLKTYMPSCIHEMSHQMGLIDLYQFNIEMDGANKVQPKICHTNTREGGMMNNCGTFYEDSNAIAMNSNLHKRRGYFGEYLYDIPNVCKVQLLDAYHRPIPNATIKFYQDYGRELKGDPTFIGSTDANGMYTLPNRPCYAPNTTATGHILHDNPWGLIHPVGINGDFFCEVNAYGQTDYQYFDVLTFNVAYNSGNKDSYTFDMQTTINPSANFNKNDLYGIKMIDQNTGYAVGAAGTILKWDGNKWANIDSPVTTPLRAIDASAKGSLICAAGDFGTVIINSDKGWKTVSVDSNANLKACAVVSPVTIIVGGDSGELKRSTDGGKTWSRVSIGSETINSISFLNSSDGIMVCGSGVAYYTTDGGATWTAARGNLNGHTLTDCKVVSATEAWACSEQCSVYKSIDGGKTWSEYQAFGYAQPLYTLDFTAPGYGWVLGRYHTFYGVTVSKRYRKSKLTDEAISTYGDKGAFYGIDHCIPGDAWAVGKGGLIVHFIDNEAKNPLK